MRPKARLLSHKDIKHLKKEFELIGVDDGGQKIMAPKGLFYLIRVDEIDHRAANILKQEMLAKGGETAISRSVYEMEPGKSSAILMGTASQYERLIRVLKNQPFGLKDLSRELNKLIKISDSRISNIECGQYQLCFDRTLIMGILNITPDSFSEDGQFYSEDKAKNHVKEMIESGADIIDIGGESTRPGAEEVSIDEELGRVIPLIGFTSDNFEIPISIDSYKAEVVKEAVKAGATIINDIYGLRNPGMLELAGNLDLPVIIMHMKGTPKNMQEAPTYQDCVGEIIEFFRQQSQKVQEKGLAAGKIMIDPGIGFGKTVENNLEIVRRLSEFTSLGYPVVLGTSRKSFIGHTLDLPVNERLEGTAASVALGIRAGANIVRVHDVKEMKRVAHMTDAIIGI